MHYKFTLDLMVTDGKEIFPLSTNKKFYVYCFLYTEAKRPNIKDSNEIKELHQFYGEKLLKGKHSHYTGLYQGDVNRWKKESAGTPSIYDPCRTLLAIYEWNGKNDYSCYFEVHRAMAGDLKNISQGEASKKSVDPCIILADLIHSRKQNSQNVNCFYEIVVSEQNPKDIEVNQHSSESLFSKKSQVNSDGTAKNQTQGTKNVVEALRQDGKAMVGYIKESCANIKGLLKTKSEVVSKQEEKVFVLIKAKEEEYFSLGILARGNYRVPYAPQDICMRISQQGVPENQIFIFSGTNEKNFSFFAKYKVKDSIYQRLDKQESPRNTLLIRRGTDIEKSKNMLYSMIILPSDAKGSTVYLDCLKKQNAVQINIGEKFLESRNSGKDRWYKTFDDLGNEQGLQRATVEPINEKDLNSYYLRNNPFEIKIHQEKKMYFIFKNEAEQLPRSLSGKKDTIIALLGKIAVADAENLVLPRYGFANLKCTHQNGIR